jgi:hypothetical protein
MVGNEVAGQVRVRDRVLDGVQHAAIGARRLQPDDARERDHRRPVPAAVLGDQRHVVVRVMRRDRLDLRKLRVEPAGVLNDPARPPHRRGRDGCLAAARVKATEHTAVADDQPLADLRLALADLRKLGLRELRDRRHPLAEHLRQIITRPRPRDVNHARQQRDPLQRRDLPHHVGVSSHRSISNATLIRSGGSFLTSAADRTAASATVRARCGSCLTPSRSRTSRRCHFPVSTAENAAVPSGSRRPRRMCSTTISGTSASLGKYPRRWKHLSASTSAKRC